MTDKKPATWKNAIVGYDEVDPESLLANPENYRLHPREQVAALKGSLDKLGWIAPVLVNVTTQHLIDGHARVGEAIARGEPKVPVAYVQLTEEQERLALATFDPITVMAGTDQEMLDQLIQSITVDDDGLNDLLASLASPPATSTVSGESEDDVPDAPSTPEPLVNLGEVWKLDNHRLICGDSTDPEVLKRLFGKDRAVLCVTSPPYWVGREYEQEHGKGEIQAHIANAAAAIDSVMADQGHISLNTGTTAETRQGGEVRRLWLLIDWWQAEFLKRKWNLRNMRIWNKEGGFAGFAPAQDLVGQNWEFIGEFTRDKPRGQNRLSDAPEWALAGVWDCQPQTASVGHTAPFPVEIPRRETLLYTHEDEIVYEPYCGSGTTIIAAEQLGRRCYAAELDPGYAQLTIERWMRDTGKEAVREDGLKWSTLLEQSEKVSA